MREFEVMYLLPVNIVVLDNDTELLSWEERTSILHVLGKALLWFYIETILFIISINVKQFVFNLRKATSKPLKQKC